ncbi:hypothetical protein CHS0354_013172, partial [Potamilus streckersoni]
MFFDSDSEVYKSEKTLYTLKKSLFSTDFKDVELNTSKVILKPLKRNLEEKEKYWNLYSKGSISAKDLPDGINCSSKCKNINHCQVDNHGLYNSCHLFDCESAVSKEACSDSSSPKVSFVPISPDDCAQDGSSLRSEICSSPGTKMDDVDIVLGAIKKESKKSTYRNKDLYVLFFIGGELKILRRPGILSNGDLLE